MNSQTNVASMMPYANIVEDDGMRDNNQVYHNTKILLKLYPHVKWRVSTSITELDQSCRQTSGSGLIDVVEYLADIDVRVNSERLHERLRSIEYSKGILKLVDKCLMLLKEYPENGEKYYQIISVTYLSGNNVGENEALEALNISRSSYYRDKKKATLLLGVILWGFVIPETKELNFR